MIVRWLTISSLAVAAAGCGSGSSVAPVRLVGNGVEERLTTERGAFAGLKVRFAGERRYALEVAIDPTESSTRRLVCSTGATELFRVAAAADELFSDFAVHPSGDVTLAVERTSRERNGYELVRLAASGAVRSRDVLAAARVPASDRPDLPDPPFLMRSTPDYALTDGWLRVEARGEDAAVAWLSRVEAGGINDVASGASALRWTGIAYEEAWSRVVDGRHVAQPAAWAYDEFRWREAAVRPLLAVFDDGGVVVGRSFTQSRCLAVNRTFGEFGNTQCRTEFPSATETEWLPFAWTSFATDGTRDGTRSLSPDRAAEFVVFDLAAHGDLVALAGAIVSTNASGDVVRYPAEPGADPAMVPYDGFAAVLERRSGALRCSRAVDGSGRGDYLAAIRPAPDGTLLAAGAAGWDRWYGGMSISRGADPWLVALSATCEPLASRTFAFASPQRHNHFLALDARPDRISAVGFSDAPMTHSGDGGHVDQRMFGGLRIDLR